MPWKCLNLLDLVHIFKVYNMRMSENKYTEKEIEWALSELKKKHPERANREQAIKLLDTMKGFTNIVVEKLKKDKKSGKIKEKLLN